MADEQRLKLEMSIPFNQPSEAQIACNSLSVDAEPKRGGVHKTITVNGNIMNVMLTSTEARTLRVSANSFLEHLILVTRTIKEFGQESAMT